MGICSSVCSYSIATPHSLWLRHCVQQLSSSEGISSCIFDCLPKQVKCSLSLEICYVYEHFGGFITSECYSLAQSENPLWFHRLMDLAAVLCSDPLRRVFHQASTFGAAGVHPAFYSFTTRMVNADSPYICWCNSHSIFAGRMLLMHRFSDCTCSLSRAEIVLAVSASHSLCCSLSTCVIT